MSPTDLRPPSREELEPLCEVSRANPYLFAGQILAWIVVGTAALVLGILGLKPDLAGALEPLLGGCALFLVLGLWTALRPGQVNLAVLGMVLLIGSGTYLAAYHAEPRAVQGGLYGIILGIYFLVMTVQVSLIAGRVPWRAARRQWATVLTEALSREPERDPSVLCFRFKSSRGFTMNGRAVWLGSHWLVKMGLGRMAAALYRPGDFTVQGNDGPQNVLIKVQRRAPGSKSNGVAVFGTMKPAHLARYAAIESVASSQEALPPPLPFESREPVRTSGSRLRLTILGGVLILCAALFLKTGGPQALAGLWRPQAQPVDRGLMELRQKVSAQVDGIRAQSRELPPCPLVFPLLGPKGEVTPLGSYISYLAMKRASYLPMAVWRLPNAGEVFDHFDLFSAQPTPVQTVHRQELPFRFMAKEFGEGTLKEAGTEYELTLRLWGTRPERRFSARFKRSEIHLAPAWIAASLHDWTGFRPDAAQRAYLKAPFFTCAEDFQRGAKVECLFRMDPGLVRGWDLILAKNPDNSFMYDRWLSMAYSRGYATTTDMLEPRMAKDAQDAMLRFDVENAQIRAKHFRQALDLILEDVRADDNNSLHYQMATQALERMNCYAEAIKLLEVWRDKHPDNQEAWMALAWAYVDYAWQARGSDFAYTVTDEGWRLMKERMKEAVKAAQQAAAIAPQDCRVWTTLLGMGNGASLPRNLMEQYFNHVLALNPCHYKAYSLYANYLMPKWFGTERELHDFLDQYADRFPKLTCEVVEDGFWDRHPHQGEAESRAHRARETANLRTSPYLGVYEQRMRAYLRTCPYDTPTWRTYAFWMAKLGRQDQVLAFAREVLAGADPEWAGVYPEVLDSCLAMERNDLIGAQELEAFDRSPAVLQARQQVYHDLLQADPNNWLALNRLAKLQVNQGRLKEAAATFARIGPNWTPWGWERREFDKAKALAVQAGGRALP